MNLIESFRIAISSLVTNRMRAILTTLGIIIGVGAVIGLTSLGRGVERYVAKQFENLGVNTLAITSTVPTGRRTAIQPLTDKEGQAIARLPGVQDVAMRYNVGATLVAGSESVNMSVRGVTPTYAAVNNWFPRGDGGRFINRDDMDNAARVVVLGQSTVEDLYGDPYFNPLGLQLQINGRIFTVIGVLEERAADSPIDQNQAALIPLTTAQTRMADARVRGGAYRVSQIQAQVESKEAIEPTSEVIEAYLAQAHGIVYAGDEDFSIGNQSDLMESVTQITTILTLFLGGVAGISLLVGGIGIMNIMLVSVSERTQEIGLRKAVGARGADILSQFLIESVLLAIIGGLLGIGLGWLISSLGGALIPDLDLSLTLDAILLATGVSSFVGVFFGLYPANRAARMRPIDALRFE